MSLHIYAENFRPYPLIDWSLPSGLVLLDGENKDTGGSNGAGKTDLFNSWFWCRYGWLPKWGSVKGGPADSVIRLKAGEPMDGTMVRVTETFTSDKIVIERRRPHKLRVWKNEVELHGITQDELDKLLGMAPERFLLAVYISQKRKRSFYHMSDGDRMDLFSVISGLEDIEKATVKAKEQKDAAERDVEKYAHSISIYQNQMLDLPDRISNLEERKALAVDAWELDNEAVEQAAKDKEAFVSLTPQDAFLDHSAIAEYESSIPVIKTEIAELFSSFNSLKEKLSETAKPESEYYAKISELDEKIRDAEFQVECHRQITEENKRILQDIDEQLRLADSAQNGKCKECSQILPEIERQKLALHYIQAAQSLQSQIRVAPEVLDLDPLYVALDQAKAKLASREAELNLLPSQIKSEMATLEAQIKTKYAEQREVESKIRGLREKAKTEYDVKLSRYDQNIKDANLVRSKSEALYKQFKDSLQDLHKQKNKLEKDLSEAQTNLAASQAAVALNSDLLSVLKGFRSLCFDGLVARISQRAGELLEIMTGSSFTTRLNQVKEDTRGKVKIVLRPAVFKNGKKVPDDFLSGGFEDGIAFAYDVAVSEAAGDGLPLLLDEVLSAMDGVRKSEAMTLLEEVAKTRPVLVVDHTSEFKAQFGTVVKICHQNEESSIMV